MISLLFPNYSLAQFTSFSAKGTATKILQDKDGYIWFSSHNGLTRYEGDSFDNFSSMSAEWRRDFSWVNDFVLVEESNKFLVATETNGIHVFDPTTGSSSKLIPELGAKRVDTIVECKGLYFFEMEGTLVEYSPNSKEHTEIATGLTINSLVNHQQSLIVGTKNGIYKLESRKLVPIFQGSYDYFISTNLGLLIAGSNKLHLIDNYNNKREAHIDFSVRVIANQVENNFVVLTTPQGNIKKLDLLTLSEVPHQYQNTQQLNTNYAFIDKTNNLWLIANSVIYNFHQTNNIAHKKHYDVYYNYLRLTNYQNEIVIGTYGAGLSAMDDMHFFNKSDVNKSFTTRAKIISDIVTYKDDLIIATFDGLWRYNGSTKSLKREPFHQNNKLLLQTKLVGDLLYVGTDGHGFYVYDVNKQEILINVDTTTQLSSHEVITVLPASDGNIWAATALGVDVFDPITKKVSTLLSNNKQKIIEIIQVDNRIFAFSKGDGFYVFNLQGERIAQSAKGIDFADGALIDGKLWFGSKHGAYIINPDDYSYKLLPNTQQYEFSDTPKLINGSIWIAYSGGLLEYPVVSNNAFNSLIKVSKTIVSGKATLANKMIHINSSNDVITLNLASLDFRDGQKKQFKYRINNSTWNQVSNNQITLTGLSSGDYAIEIMGTNSLGQWSTNKAFVDIEVAYPWYWIPQLRYLYVLLVVALIAMTVWLLTLRARSINHIYQMLDSEVTLRGHIKKNLRAKLNRAIELSTNDKNKGQLSTLLVSSLEELNASESSEPDTLTHGSLFIALPFLAEYFHKRFHINVELKLLVEEDCMDIQMQSDIYRIIYQSILSSITNETGRSFIVEISKFNDKVWLKISDDASGFIGFDSKIKFDITTYFVRKTADKYRATLTCFGEADEGSHLHISFPLELRE